MLCPVELRERDGRGRGTRTPNRLIWNQVLYQLSYAPTMAGAERLELSEAGFGGLPVPCTTPVRWREDVDLNHKACTPPRCSPISAKREGERCWSGVIALEAIAGNLPAFLPEDGVSPLVERDEIVSRMVAFASQIFSLAVPHGTHSPR